MITEKWKDVIGYEGLYQISSDGRVKSSYRHPGAVGHFGTTIIDSEGYPQIRLVKNGVTSVYRVHNLVLTAFCGLRPDGYQCLHNDGNRQNIKLENLKWGTQFENADDAIRHGTQVRGETSGRAKLTTDQVLIIKRLSSYGHSLRSLGKRFRVDHTTIGAIKTGKSWSHLKDW